MTFVTATDDIRAGEKFVNEFWEKHSHHRHEIENFKILSIEIW